MRMVVSVSNLLIGLCLAFPAGAQVQYQPLGQPATVKPALQQMVASNEARGMDAAKQGMARGGYGFSSEATPYGLYIMAVAPGSRAQTAGLKAGQVVMELDGKTTVGMTNGQFIALIKSNPATGFDFKLSDASVIHLPPLSAQVAATLQAPVAPTEGCIGHPLAQCLAHMQAVLQIDTVEIASQLGRASDTDVNDKPIGGAGILTATAHFADQPSPHVVTFKQDGAGNVTSVEISLERSPEVARTSEEYASTGLGVIFRAVLPTSCTAPGGDLAAFKFFENVVKPTIHAGRKDTTIDETHAETTTMSLSTPLSYCGVKVRYSNIRGYDTNEIDEYNEHGAYSFSTVEISKD